MITLFKHLLRILVIVALAVWLADRPGTARIVWHDTIIETSAALLALGVFLLAYVFYLLLRLWNFLRYGPENWRLRRKMRKTEEGYTKLSDGFIALAAGDTAEAGYLAVRARKSLGITPLTQLLQAQAAQLAGDRKSALEIFRALAARPESAALGYRGLIMDARRQGDWTGVALLADKLKAVAPKTPLLQLVNFETAARRQAWDEALESLKQATKLGLVDAGQGKEYRAALFVADAQTAMQHNHFDKALSCAEQAMRLASSWAPAVIALAQSQWGAGHQRASTRTIEKHWEQVQHPVLADLYRATESTPLDAYKKLERLCRTDEDSRVARHVLAESALAASVWGEARRHLLALVQQDRATTTTYKLLASLERRENGDDLAATRWLGKATEAPRDPVWLCSSCGGTHSEWQATCGHCGAFNTLAWESPGRSRARDGLAAALAPQPHQVERDLF